MFTVSCIVGSSISWSFQEGLFYREERGVAWKRREKSMSIGESRTVACRETVTNLSKQFVFGRTKRPAALNWGFHIDVSNESITSKDYPRYDL
ncbi:MAG: hypothetical protein Tsb009_00770 [Planctomycetaceae bacterium]